MRDAIAKDAPQARARGARRPRERPCEDAKRPVAEATHGRKITTIYEGTSEIQQIVIAKGLGLPSG